LILNIDDNIYIFFYSTIKQKIAITFSIPTTNKDIIRLNSYFTEITSSFGKIIDLFNHEITGWN
jgi:hypothetical protein